MESACELGRAAFHLSGLARICAHKPVVVLHVQSICLIYRTGSSDRRVDRRFLPALPAVAWVASGGVRLRRARARLHDPDFLLALLCDVRIGHLLAGLFVVAHHGIYAKTIVACSAWTGFCHVCL